MTKLALYYFDECPYCRKVLRFIKDEGIDVVYKNIHSDSAAREELIEVGGKLQVPCLFINGKPLYESDDIISHLKGNR